MPNIVNRSFLFPVCCAIIASQAHATNRVVSPTGTYNTISGAIAASSDGDRILVEPGTCTGWLNIDKSLSILPNVEGGKYNVNGQVRIQTSSTPRNVTISGMRAAGQVYNYNTGSGRLDIRIADSYLESGTFSLPNVHVELYRDSLPNGVSFASATIVGNVVGGTSYSAALLNQVSGSTLADPLLVIGNILLPTANGVNTPFIIDLNSSVEFHVENNYVSNATTTAKFFRMQGSPPVGQVTSSVSNNTFYRSVSANQTSIYGQVGIVTVNIQNNATIGDTGPQVDWQFRSGLTTYNLYAAPSWINTSTGQPTVGSPLLNAGDPDPRYLDLDLTTNDVGCYGGSNSRANFTTGMGSAVVGFMQAPRVVAQGEPVNISATGFDR